MLENRVEAIHIENAFKIFMDKMDSAEKSVQEYDCYSEEKVEKELDKIWSRIGSMKCTNLLLNFLSKFTLENRTYVCYNKVVNEQSEAGELGNIIFPERER